jgi:hypothetical protein
LDPFSITDYNLRDTFVLNLYSPQLKLHLLPCLNDDSKSFEDVKTLALSYEKQMAQFSRPDGNTSAIVSVQSVSQQPIINPPSSAVMVCGVCLRLAAGSDIGARLEIGVIRALKDLIVFTRF